MKTCPACAGMAAELEVECSYCDEGRIPTRADLLFGEDRMERVRRRVGRRRRQVRHARSLWKDRNAPIVATWIEIPRNLLADQPMLRSLIENQLMRQLADFTPLSWRLDEAKRALRGENATSPWVYETNVMVREESGDLFMRNRAVLLAERRRVPK